MTKKDDTENEKIEEVQEEIQDEPVIASKAKQSQDQLKNDSEKDKIEQLENQLKRSLADYQNLEKRILEERRTWIQQANKGILLRLLPAFDTLELALKHSKDQGVSMSIQQIMSALKEEGVEKIKTVGEDFDPYLMECVQTVEGENGKVVEELRSGYTLYDKVLRPAQVVVGKSV